MAATSKDWGRIAAEAGYYDQAHLIGDCRELAGLTPGAFRARQTARASRDYPVPGVLGGHSGASQARAAALSMWKTA